MGKSIAEWILCTGVTVGLVTRTTFFIYGSKKLYVTKVHPNMVLLEGRDVAFPALPRILPPPNLSFFEILNLSKTFNEDVLSKINKSTP